MDEVLGQRHSINPPVLIASTATEDTADTANIPDPVPSDTATGSGAGSETPGPNRKRGRGDDDFLQPLKEDMALQREAEERRLFRYWREWLMNSSHLNVERTAGPSSL